MRKKKQINGSRKGPSGNEYLSTKSDFYTGEPTDSPLYQNQPASRDARRPTQTARHKSDTDFHRDKADPRDRMALLAILKAVAMVLVLLIAFFLLWKGIGIYEDKIVAENQAIPANTPLMQPVDTSPGVSLVEMGSNDLLVEQLKVWNETERLMQRVDALLHRNNFDQAIARCLQALELDPLHRGAMERLGRLYTELGRHNEAINTYIRLLMIDPSDKGVQQELVKSLALNGDANAVVATSEWYMELNSYNEDVQRYLSDAHYTLGHFNEAVEDYQRVLKDSPNDASALENMAVSYMHLEKYDAALQAWTRLSEVNYRDQNCYKQIAICNAQLENGLETVQILGKAAHLFGQNTVMIWIQDPMLDPVRPDRTFKDFSKRLGSKEFQQWLDTVAQALEEDQQQKSVVPLLETEKQGVIDENLLKLDK